MDRWDIPADKRAASTIATTDDCGWNGRVDLGRVVVS